MGLGLRPMAKGQGPTLQEPEDGVEGPGEDGMEGVQELGLGLQAVEGEAARDQVQVHAQELPRHRREAPGLPVVPGLGAFLLDAEPPGVGPPADVVCVGSLLAPRQFWVGDAQGHRVAGRAHLPVVPPGLEALGTLHLPELEAAWPGQAPRLQTVLHLLVLPRQVEVAVGAVRIKGQVSVICWGEMDRR